MKAMILAAGLGTRLKPLTETRPKALVELSGRTLLEITITRLASFGVTDFIVNVHHFADQVAAYLQSRNNFGLHIELSREDDLLLDTGGGLKKASWFFLNESSQRSAGKQLSGVIPNAVRDPGKSSKQSPLDLIQNSSETNGEPFLLHNVDVISNIDLRSMLLFHNDHQALATLAVQSRPSSRLLLFDDHLQLTARATSDAAPEWVRGALASPLQEGTASVHPDEGRAVPRNDKNAGALAPEGPFHALAFSGIHILSPRILPLLTETGVFSIIDSYLRLASQGHQILAFRADQYYWRDLGRPSDLAQAALDLRQKLFS